MHLILAGDKITTFFETHFTNQNQARIDEKRNRGWHFPHLFGPAANSCKLFSCR
jgi:hypothetical protein